MPAPPLPAIARLSSICRGWSHRYPTLLRSEPALPVQKVHPPSHISLDRLAVTTHRSASSSPLVTNDRERRQPTFLAKGAFAGAAVADAILALEALLETLSNIDEEGLQVACTSFSVALMNSCTTNQAAIHRANNDKKICDYCVKIF